MVAIYILIGIICGIFGGMGLGGGTLLIPLLTLVLKFNQKISQGISLISFCIMASIVLIIHKKNGYIDIKKAFFLGIFSTVSAILGAILVNNVSSIYLKEMFGVLLIGISIYSIVIELKNNYKI